jgi:hypothetical protein
METPKPGPNFDPMTDSGPYLAGQDVLPVSERGMPNLTKAPSHLDGRALNADRVDAQAMKRFVVDPKRRQLENAAQAAKGADTSFGSRLGAAHANQYLNKTPLNDAINRKMMQLVSMGLV